MIDDSRTVTRSVPPIREVVGSFATREAFDSAVSALLARGVERADLSVLASHASLEAAAPPPRPRDDALAALVGELSYLGPLTTAGLLAVVGGPVTTAVAAIVAAGLTGLAAKDYLDEVTSHPDTGAFARAVEEGGVVLWVRIGPDEEPAALISAMSALGGANVHVIEREP